MFIDLDCFWTYRLTRIIIKENRITTKTKKEISILTKQKLRLIKNLNKRWILELKIKKN